MQVTFPSVINPEKYLFGVNSDNYRTAELEPSFEFQERRGDGSWTWPQLVTRKFAAEYLASLATAMMENDDLTDHMYWRFKSRPTDEEIEFAAKVVFKAGKKVRYFSKEFKRISAVRAKQYDKRWELINESMDGSPRAIFNFLTSSYTRDGLSQYMYAEKIRQWFYADRKRYRKYSMEDPAEFLGWTSDYNQQAAIKAAINACRSAIAIRKERKDFKEYITDVNHRAMVTKLEW